MWSGVVGVTDTTDTDPAPTLYLEDGTPVKPRLIEGDCEGDVSGEGHYGYRLNETVASATLYFEEADDDE